MASTRLGIHYWKCDRPAAFHGTAQGARRRTAAELQMPVRELLARHFGAAPDDLRDGGGQGNHLTFTAKVAGHDVFVRIEDGPERDDYMAVESWVLERVRALGIPTPRVHASDATRTALPFAWQCLERIPAPDLNQLWKAGRLDEAAIAHHLGSLVARWQALPVAGFGPFDVARLAGDGALHGLHARYVDYFETRLDDHLAFLVARGLLDASTTARMRAAIDAHRDLLALPSSCLVHKDLALWNVLGDERTVAAVIDWDDCIGGDPMDDLALLGCFHDGAFLRAAFAGYASVRPLPADAIPRFWLHLLRNMLFKAVIRVGAGYFDHDSAFFLIGAGGDGASLKARTLERLDAALTALEGGGDPFSL